MQIEYSIGQAFFPGSDKLTNALTLRVLLNCLIELDRVYLQQMHRKGHAIPLLYQSGVVYGRTREWEETPRLYHRQYGDCKSLSATWIAEQSLRGVRCAPVFRFVENPDGSTDYHILVALGNGRFEDPSKRLGMGAVEVAKFYGPQAIKSEQLFGCCI